MVVLKFSIFTVIIITLKIFTKLFFVEKLVMKIIIKVARHTNAYFDGWIKNLFIVDIL